MALSAGGASPALRPVSEGQPPFDRAAFEARKQANFAQLLFKASRLLNDEALRRVREATGAPHIRAAHTALFPHIPFEGIRLTELAQRVGVTKQAVQQLVDELEAMGALARAADPADGRAKRIVWTELGKAGLLHGVGVLDGIDAEVESAVGAASLAEARRVLGAVIARLEER